MYKLSLLCSANTKLDIYLVHNSKEEDNGNNECVCRIRAIMDQPCLVFGGAVLQTKMTRK